MIDLTPRQKIVASIVTVSYGRRDLLVSMLESLAVTTDGNVEVIVVDNDSPDDTADWVREQTVGVRLIEAGRNLGFGQGSNLGVRAASTEVSVLVNTDVTFHPNWLQPLLDAVGRTGAAAPVSVDSLGRLVEGGAVIDGDGHAQLVTSAFLGPDRGSHQRVTAHASAACLAIRTATFVDCGGFDPAFGLGYHEDVDLLAALGQQHVDVTLCPRSRIVHQSGGSFGSMQSRRLAARNQRRSRRRWSWALSDLEWPDDFATAAALDHHHHAVVVIRPPHGLAQSMVEAIVGELKAVDELVSVVVSEATWAPDSREALEQIGAELASIEREPSFDLEVVWPGHSHAATGRKPHIVQNSDDWRDILERRGAALTRGANAMKHPYLAATTAARW